MENTVFFKLIILVVFKITFSVSGDNFFPNKIISSLSKELNIIDFFNPTDETGKEKGNKFEYGSMSFMHPKIFGYLGDGLEYEDEFINFFEINLSLFQKNEVDDFVFFIEVYYSRQQCNFEIFNNSMLFKLTKGSGKISIPVSVYHLEKKEIKDLLLFKSK
ncbi:hypothetical protein [Flavobacterium sp. ENC]|uniref:hypothetical protein n=1 Tax=Flavobacterium sp. ENC TaxID=2897330 RepID=UPI001E5861FF|nr:hypothetical protein [Flavobacterium sp. ENC]MCD0464946.1 hypothetical protein [Flavobacterium sp. ENC]